MGATQKNSFLQTVAPGERVWEKSTEGIVTDFKIQEGKLIPEQEQTFLCLESNYFQVWYCLMKQKGLLFEYICSYLKDKVATVKEHKS